MTIDDPKLTAYALGELDDAGDRAAVEALLASDDAARRFVDETRQAAALLTRGLAAAEQPSLTTAQKESIAAASAGGPLPYATPRPRGPARPWVRTLLATAACAAVAAAGFAVLLPARQKARSVAWDTRRPAGQATMTYSNESKGVTPLDREAGAPLGTVPAKPESGKALKEVEVLRQGQSLPSNNDYYEWKAPQPGGGSGGGRFGNQPANAGDQVVQFGRSIATPAGPNAATGSESLARGVDAVTEYGLQQQQQQGLAERYAKTPAPADGPAPVAIPAPVDVGAKLDTRRSGVQVNGGALQLDGTEIAERLRSEAPATRVPAQFPALQEAQKKLDAGLGDVRDALARHDRPAAVTALAKARDELHDQLANLTPQEITRANARFKQLEDAVSANESYALIHDNPYLAATDAPLSTFSIDVDTGSYSNVRRFLNQGHLPPPDAVRIEEMLNYVPYDYATPKPDDKAPFAATVEVATCPWNTSNRLARVAIKGREIAHDKRPVSNLVFLIDVSGSMNEPRKLPLVKAGLKQMVNELTENDRVAIVVYAGAAGLVLPSTNADPKNRETILAAIDNLSAGGSTNGGHGIELAYRVAAESFIQGGTNRVLLATDGDWNVGITDQNSLTHLIEDKAKSGVFLSILGFGFGNLKDATLERLADKGNGHYAYVDDLKEARKVLVEEMSGTLVTIAKDVKVQVEFNPAQVKSYRLIGYENRMLRKEDFNNDKVDAGEIGAGHRVTALYEIVPAGAPATQPAAARPAAAPAVQSGQSADVDPLKYAARAAAGTKVVIGDTEVTVDADGFIRHPLIGALKVAGMTPAEIDAGIAQFLRDKNIILNARARIVGGAAPASRDLLTLKVRYKQPDGDQSTKLEIPVIDSGTSYGKASDDFKFAAAVAQFGMILRESPHKGSASLDGVLELADEGKGKDEKGYRAEFLEMVRKARALSK